MKYGDEIFLGGEYNKHFINVMLQIAWINFCNSAEILTKIIENFVAEEVKPTIKGMIW